MDGVEALGQILAQPQPLLGDDPQPVLLEAIIDRPGQIAAGGVRLDNRQRALDGHGHGLSSRKARVIAAGAASGNGRGAGSVSVWMTPARAAGIAIVDARSAKVSGERRRVNYEPVSVPCQESDTPPRLIRIRPGQKPARFRRDLRSPHRRPAFLPWPRAISWRLPRLRLRSRSSFHLSTGDPRRLSDSKPLLLF